jgi:hypothetical protein
LCRLSVCRQNVFSTKRQGTRKESATEHFLLILSLRPPFFTNIYKENTLNNVLVTAIFLQSERFRSLTRLCGIKSCRFLGIKLKFDSIQQSNTKLNKIKRNFNIIGNCKQSFHPNSSNFVLSFLHYLKIFGNISDSFEFRKFQPHHAKAMEKDNKSILQLPYNVD